MESKIRTAAYVRVSMDSEQMQHSLQAQREYYEELIRNRTDWEYAGIYVDYGISGTRMKQRVGFCKMLEECKNGNIDKILVKSVSRFSRNTLDLLNTVRQLKKWNISVYFEEQKVDSMTENGELMLTLMASIAQAESESISENVKWAIRSGFKKGIRNTKRRTFGYKWKDELMTIVPEEADAVKQIYEDFLDGHSQTEIARQLTNRGIKSIHGNAFPVRSISNILRKITYTGNTLLQKTYILDPISKRKIINQGQLPQYFIQNTHEAIIDMDTFQKVQKVLGRKKQKGEFPYNRTGEKYPFTMKVICGCCGRHYTRQLWNTSKIGKKRPTWVCTGKKSEKSGRCDSKNISELKLMEISEKVLDIPVFDENIFSNKVESITVQGVDKLLFRMNDGTERSADITSEQKTDIQ